AFSLARAADELVDHLLRQTRRGAFPVIRQKINIKAFGGGDCVDFHFLCQRNSDRASIRIAARNTYKRGGARTELLDSHRDRLLEVDDDDRTRHTYVGFDDLIKMKEQPHKAAVGDCFDLAFDRVVCPRTKGRSEENQSRQKYERRPAAPASRP